MTPVRKKPVPPRPDMEIEEVVGKRDEGKGNQAGSGFETDSAAVNRRRLLKGKGKEVRTKKSAFEKLPREIIQQILYTADPNTFDSLTLLNSDWHRASRSALLYTHQLRKCGITNTPDEPTEDSLPGLIRLFTAEARRGLFESLLRPAVTEIQLLCSATSSSAAFPGGEAFRFSFSSRGTHLLAFNSTRIFVIYLSSREVKVKRELKISRRPVTADILDDGSVLAILSSNDLVSLYDLREEKAKYIRCLPLENAPRAIALSPGAEVLSAAYNAGIEVYSLLPEAAPTDRRAVDCDPVDSLAFSSDGTILLGTTLNNKSPTTVIVSAQHFSTDMPVEGLAQLWTTQVLFPRSSRDSSHASLLPEDDAKDENTWTFTYDRVYEMFRAVRVDDLRNGHTYFAGPNDENRGVIAPVTLPAPTADGRMVAAGFGGGKIWLHGIPERLELPVETGSDSSVPSTPERSDSIGGSNQRGQLGTIVVPQWQVLCDKMRNVFRCGREIGEVPGLSEVRFVKSSEGTERLVAVAGGGVDALFGESGGETFEAIGGGRVILYDFGRGPRAGEKTVISIEIGDGIQGPVETLQEEIRALEVEVDIVRRRTVAQRRQNDRRQRSVMPLQTTAPGPNTDAPQIPRTSPASAPLVRRAPPITPSNDETHEFLDLPYSHGDPRSRTSLNRAATAARNVPQTVDRNRYHRVVGPDGRPLPQNHVLLRGPREEEWIPPPPPYTPRNDHAPPLPPHLLQSLQGLPRTGTAPPDAPPQQSRGVLERTRNTLGNTVDTIMRRQSVFRLNLSNSSTASMATIPPPPPIPQLAVPQPPQNRFADIGSSRSAPVSPMIGRPTSPQERHFFGSAYAENQYLQQQQPQPQRHQPQSSSSLLRRGSAGDVLTHPPITPDPAYEAQRQNLQLSLRTGGQTRHDQTLTPEPIHARNSPQYRPPPTRRPSPARRRTQLDETYTTADPPTVAPDEGRRTSNRGSGRQSASGRTSGGGGGSGSVRRNPSRAERSAARNVRDARRRRQERLLEQERQKGGSCVIM
ncbi:hypothetical protein RUND412_009829 [Rhizina undulata]